MCFQIKGAIIQKTAAASVARACSGIARFISHSTPEAEVKGVEPVKFMPRKELTLQTQSRRAVLSYIETLAEITEIKTYPHSAPVKNPLNAKDLPGM